jgi:hypothetical protein
MNRTDYSLLKRRQAHTPIVFVDRDAIGLTIDSLGDMDTAWSELATRHDRARAPVPPSSASVDLLWPTSSGRHRDRSEPAQLGNAAAKSLRTTGAPHTRPSGLNIIEVSLIERDFFRSLQVGC